MTFCVYRAPNLRGYGWYIVHYINVDCLMANSYIPNQIKSNLFCNTYTIVFTFAQAGYILHT